MKKYIFLVLMVLFLAAACIVYVPYPRESPPPGEEEYYEEEYREYPERTDISYFHDYLSQYGMWVNYAPHGYVWIPRVTRYGWHPYSHGRWVWTDWGWTWVSRFEWGWAPFHYGRWGWDIDLGWFWVPDTVWGPAWVTWRRGHLHIGWAPLPPEAEWLTGIGITSLPFSLPFSYWIFVDGRYFLEPHIYRYILPYERNMTIINYTVIQTNIVVQDRRIINRGIERDWISRLAKRKVTAYELRDARRPQVTKIRRENLEVYRPSIREKEEAVPKKALNREEAVVKISREEFERAEEIQIREVHEREVRVVEESQQQEVKELKRKQEEEKKEAESPTDKEKINKEYEKKVVKLKKSHQEEKAKIEKRHKVEKEKIKKKKIK